MSNTLRLFFFLRHFCHFYYFLFLYSCVFLIRLLKVSTLFFNNCCIDVEQNFVFSIVVVVAAVVTVVSVVVVVVVAAVVVVLAVVENSKENWTNLGQLKKISILFIGHCKEISLLKDWNLILLGDSKVIYYMLYYNFFYTQLAFVFDLQKNLCIVYDNTDAFCLQQNVNIFYGSFFFFLRASFQSLSLFFGNVYVVFLYLQKKTIKNILYPLKIHMSYVSYMSYVS